MKGKYLFIVIVFAALITSCKKGDQDPYRSFLSKAAILEGDWVVSSFLQNGEEKEIFTTYIKSYKGDCDTQYLTHVDSILYQQLTFGRLGAYHNNSIVSRIDTSFLPGGITDTACTNKYNYIRSPYDTILISRGLWTFTGTLYDDPFEEKLLIYDNNIDSAFLWDILKLESDELLLFRKYYDENENPVEEELRLLPK